MRNPRIHAFNAFFVSAGVLAGLSCQSALAAFIGLSPKATYLYTANDSSAVDAAAVDLSTMSIAPGMLIELTEAGDYDAGGGIDNQTALVAVFSSSPTLLASNNLHRVSGAIDAGDDFTTSVTYETSQSTDIAEDFFVPTTGVQVVVPAGAAYLFFTPNDGKFGDNADPNGNFGALVSIVPEPASAGIMVAGLLLATPALRRRGSR